MSLLKSIQKSIEKDIVIFTSDIAEKFGISQDTLLEMWTDISKMKIKNKDVKKTKKNKSSWLQFCKDQRIIIKKDNPTMSFGDISKMIGEKWQLLSKEDKDAYISPVEDNVVVDKKKEEVKSKKEKKTKKTKNDKNKEEQLVSDTEKEVEDGILGILKEDQVEEVFEKNFTKVSDMEKEDVMDEVAFHTNILTNMNEVSLKKKKKSELEDMCMSLCVAKSGKKEDMITRLLNLKKSSENKHGISEDEEEEKDDATVSSYHSEDEY